MEKKIKYLLKREKKLFSTKLTYRIQKNPVVLFIKKHGKGEFFELKDNDKFEYIDSSGEEKVMKLDGNSNKIYNGGVLMDLYIVHESYPYPIPRSPVVDAESVQIAINKTLHDIKKWEADHERARAGTIKAYAYFVLGAIGLFIVWALVKPAGIPLIPTPWNMGGETAVNTVATVVANNTIPNIIG